MASSSGQKVSSKLVLLSLLESVVGTRVRNSVGIQQNDSSDLRSLIGLPSVARLGLTVIIGSSTRWSNFCFRSSLKWKTIKSEIDAAMRRISKITIAITIIVAKKVFIFVQLYFCYNVLVSHRNGAVINDFINGAREPDLVISRWNYSKLRAERIGLSVGNTGN